MKVEIKGLGIGAAVDVQEEIRGKWVSKGVEVLRKGEVLEVASKGNVRVFLSEEEKG